MTVPYYPIVIPSHAGSPGVPPTQKTPEINELESNKKILKIWSHNFENQKSWSIFRFGIFFVPDRRFWGKVVADNRELSHPEKKHRSSHELVLSFTYSFAYSFAMVKITRVHNILTNVNWRNQLIFNSEMMKFSWWRKSVCSWWNDEMMKFCWWRKWCASDEMMKWWSLLFVLLMKWWRKCCAHYPW